MKIISDINVYSYVPTRIVQLPFPSSFKTYT